MTNPSVPDEKQERQSKKDTGPQAVPPKVEKMEAVSVVTPKGAMAETVFDPDGNPRIGYAIKSKSGRLSIEPSMKLTDREYSPPVDPFHLIEKGVVLLASKIVDHESDETLGTNIRAFIHRYADVTDFVEQLIETYVKMTWVCDKFTALPYLRWLGEPETGKTRQLVVAAHLCYKAMLAGGATTSAPIFRLIDRYQGTFVIDEADYKKSDLYSETIKILNNGYMKGLFILRAEQVGNSHEVRAFDPFGPKLLTTRATFDDFATESRCITLHTVDKQMRADVPVQLPKAFYEEALHLRNQLLDWRFKNYERIQITESTLLHDSPRMAQIAAPLLAVSQDQGFNLRLQKFLGKRSSAERNERPQAVMVEAIQKSLKGASGGWLMVKAVADIASRLAESEGIEEVKMSFNGPVPLYSPKRAGNLLRSMGLKTERTKEGYHFNVTAEKLKGLAERYGRIEKKDGDGKK